MAIDSVTGKRIKIVKTKLDIEKEKKAKAMPKFDTNYEEELKRQLFEDMKTEEVVISDVFEEDNTHTGHHARPGEEWDVPITEEILYFDPELSYEITNYRPLTLEKGLDFDPAPFMEMARIYNETGSYTKFPKGSKPHKEL